jgi:hypothetical protein
MAKMATFILRVAISHAKYIEGTRLSPSSPPSPSDQGVPAFLPAYFGTVDAGYNGRQQLDHANAAIAKRLDSAHALPPFGQDVAIASLRPGQRGGNKRRSEMPQSGSQGMAQPGGEKAATGLPTAMARRPGWNNAGRAWGRTFQPRVDNRAQRKAEAKAAREALLAEWCQGIGGVGNLTRAELDLLRQAAELVLGRPPRTHEERTRNANTVARILLTMGLIDPGRHRREQPSELAGLLDDRHD